MSSRGLMEAAGSASRLPSAQRFSRRVAWASLKRRGGSSLGHRGRGLSAVSGRGLIGTSGPSLLSTAHPRLSVANSCSPSRRSHTSRTSRGNSRPKDRQLARRAATTTRIVGSAGLCSSTQVSTRTITLRLHKEVRALLEKEARRRRTSREVLLERIIGEYLQDLVDAREVMRQRRARAARSRTPAHLRDDYAASTFAYSFHTRSSSSSSLLSAAPAASESLPTLCWFT